MSRSPNEERPHRLRAIRQFVPRSCSFTLKNEQSLPDEVAQIKAGWETASVAQFPAKIGSLGIATLYRAVKGKKVPKNVDTGTALVTTTNAAKFGG